MINIFMCWIIKIIIIQMNELFEIKNIEKIAQYLIMIKLKFKIF